jgi:hypothetical protein
MLEHPNSPSIPSLASVQFNLVIGLLGSLFKDLRFDAAQFNPKPCGFFLAFWGAISA